MQLDFHQVDAFTQRPFGGNPAMVYRLDAWLDDQLMQRIAAEHNLSETAFLVKEGSAWHIRWFTPKAEVPLSGHATLASAHVLFELYQEPGDRLEFISKSGELRVTREEEGRLALDFPAQVPQEAGVTLELEQALGVAPVDALGANFLLVVLESEQAVRECTPDFKALAKLPWSGVIVTAPGMKLDFVSRFFAPVIGIDEDPVTGAAHCALIPYWANRLGKRVLRAEQCSARSGELWCRLDGDRVNIAGHSVLVASGRFWV